MKKSTDPVLERPGHDALWLWFGLSRASWLVIPRVLMHEMPDDWQEKMAALLNEWHDHWKNMPEIEIEVHAKKNGKLIKMPEFLNDYRYPQKSQIDKCK